MSALSVVAHKQHAPSEQVAGHAGCSVAYFLDSPSRLANKCYFSRLLDIVRRPEGAPLLKALSEAEGQLVTILAVNPSIGQQHTLLHCQKHLCTHLLSPVLPVADLRELPLLLMPALVNNNQSLLLQTLRPLLLLSLTVCTSFTLWRSCCPDGCQEHCSTSCWSVGGAQSSGRGKRVCLP